MLTAHGKLPSFARLDKLKRVLLIFITIPALSQDIGGLYRLSDAKTFSISPENPTGGRGQGAMATAGTAAREARDLGQGWKMNPSIVIEPKQTATLAEITGQGAVQHIWMTPTAPRGIRSFECTGMAKKSRR